MRNFSEAYVRTLYEDFRSMKRYLDRLAFYDRHFGLIPFQYPSFDPELSFFFDPEKTRMLIDLLHLERNNPDLSEKVFSFDQVYRFSIKPVNSNNPQYSTFILSKFLMAEPGWETYLETRGPSGDIRLLDEGNRVINFIEYKLQNEYDKSARVHCMTVFYKGFHDAFLQQVHLPDKKRKFLELYLYAQGILYAKYLGALKARLPQRRRTEKKEPKKNDFDRTALLSELGAIDLLARKYASVPTPETTLAFAEIIGQITGKTETQQKTVLQAAGEKGGRRTAEKS